MAFLRAAFRNRRFVAAASSASLAFLGCAATFWGADDHDDDVVMLGDLRRTVAGCGGAARLAFCDGGASSPSPPPSSLLMQKHAALLGSADDSPIRQSVVELLTRMQVVIRDRVNALERQHTPAGETPVEVQVDVDDRRAQGKRGVAMVIQGGRVFEKGGFSMTVMSKPLSAGMARQMSSNHAGLRERLEQVAAADKAAADSGAEVVPSQAAPLKMWVCGLSLILHPKHPLGATVHLNYRYFEVLKGDEVVAWWFGGGNDLTPIYVDEADAVHFHRTLKDVCDRHDNEFYPRFKTWADQYFYHSARKEARGVGGIFFDDLCSAEGDGKSPAKLFGFVKDCIEAFPRAYFPRLEAKLGLPYTEAMREWQGLRHGRYVEFNLIYDRGTKFGFHVPGVNIENVLVSLPLNVRFEYKNSPAPGSPEADLLALLTGPPRDWVGAEETSKS